VITGVQWGQLTQFTCKLEELFVCWYDFKFNILCECFLDVNFWSKKPSFDGIENQPFRLCKAKDIQENAPQIQIHHTCRETGSWCFNFECPSLNSNTKFDWLLSRYTVQSANIRWIRRCVEGFLHVCMASRFKINVTNFVLLL